MSDSSSNQGRFIRAALIIFPAGTIVLGIASFGIWWSNKVKKEQRSYAYATALRRDMNSSAIERYMSILREVMRQSESERLPAIAGFLESTMGAENMGYAVRRDRFVQGPTEASVIDVEVTGKRRPREVVLVLVPYGDGARAEAESGALAALMSLAHALTGEAQTRTLRFAALPVGLKDSEGRSALDRLAGAMRGREERLTEVFVLGGVAESVLAEIRLAFRVVQTGAIIHSLPPTQDTAATLGATRALQATVIKAAR